MAGTTSILSVDPGLRHPAAALFRRGQLRAASRVRVPSSWHGLGVGERCRLIGGAIHAWAEQEGLEMSAMIEGLELELAGDAAGARTVRRARGVEQVVIEWPQIYRLSKSKGDPNDLPGLAGVGMAIGGRLDVEVVSYLPKQWAGGTRKAETGDPLDSPRGRLVWRCLSHDERGRVVRSHDAIDAVGLGLHHLGRLQRRVYPGAT